MSSGQDVVDILLYTSSLVGSGIDLASGDLRMASQMGMEKFVPR